MAYNKSNDPLDPQGRSIIIQVAYKGTVELAAARNIDPTSAEFGAIFDAHVELLVAKVEEQKEAFFTHIAAVKQNNGGGGGSHAPQQSANVEQQMAAEFGATPASDGATLRIMNPEDQDGPIPSWLVTAASALGIDAVYDNRRTKTGQQPWFREYVPKGATPKGRSKQGEPKPAGFWPPND